VARPLLVKFPAPRHQVYDVINETIEANEIPPEKWYPKGHMPERVREWPLSKDIEIDNPFATRGHRRNYPTTRASTSR
jgi:hypothetical protein